MKNRIKTQRSILSLTQSELAKIIKVSPLQIQNYESGKQLPSVKIAFKLADALKLNVRLLFVEKENEQATAELKVLDTIISCSNQKELNTAIKMANNYKVLHGPSVSQVWNNIRVNMKQDIETWYYDIARHEISRELKKIGFAL